MRKIEIYKKLEGKFLILTKKSDGLVVKGILKELIVDGDKVDLHIKGDYNEWFIDTQNILDMKVCEPKGSGQ